MLKRILFNRVLVALIDDIRKLRGQFGVWGVSEEPSRVSVDTDKARKLLE